MSFCVHVHVRCHIIINITDLTVERCLSHEKANSSSWRLILSAASRLLPSLRSHPLKTDSLAEAVLTYSLNVHSLLGKAGCFSHASSHTMGLSSGGHDVHVDANLSNSNETKRI